MVDQFVKRYVGIPYDVLVRFESFVFLVDFIIWIPRVEFKIPIILGRTFFSIGRELLDIEND